MSGDRALPPPDEEEWPRQRLIELLGAAALCHHIGPSQTAFCAKLRQRLEVDGPVHLTQDDRDIIDCLDRRVRGIDDPWPPTKIDKAANLWQAGVETKRMGEALGVSKNAVVGKIHRLFKAGDLRFPPRGSPIIRDGRTPAPHAPRRPKVTLAPFLSVVPIPSRDPGAAITDPTRAGHGRRVVPKLAALVPVGDGPVAAPRPPSVTLGRYGCQFPMWSHTARVPRPPRFCDAPRVMCADGETASSYCGAHHRLTHGREIAAGA